MGGLNSKLRYSLSHSMVSNSEEQLIERNCWLIVLSNNNAFLALPVIMTLSIKDCPPASLDGDG